MLSNYGPVAGGNDEWFVEPLAVSDLGDGHVSIFLL